jgi:hypothetical protein
MTEQEWLTTTDLGQMQEFLEAKAGQLSERKKMLFGCACNRRKFQDSLNETPVARMVEAHELVLDGIVSQPDVRAAHEAVERAIRAAGDTSEEGTSWYGNWPAPRMTHRQRGDVEFLLVAMRGDWAYTLEFPRLLREIFGNPFRPATIDSAWQSGSVIALAQAIYSDRAFDRMPILADALEDAGCANADILNHCRQPDVHVKGCWVLDLILSKDHYNTGCR